MDPKELYQQVILDHARKPRNHGTIEGPHICVEADNPSCGDELTLHLKVDEEGKVEDVRFTGEGCAISQASASMMTVKIKGKEISDVEELKEIFRDLLTSKERPELPEGFGELKLLEGVREFPQRVNCAMLGWEALQQALNEYHTEKDSKESPEAS